MTDSRIQKWSKLLEYEKKRSTLTTIQRLALITDYLELLSSTNCYYYERRPKRIKKCSCLSMLNGNHAAKIAVANSIMQWVASPTFNQKQLLIQQIQFVEDMKVYNAQAKTRRVVDHLYRIPFVCGEDEEANKILISTRICQHAFAAIYRHGAKAFVTLPKNAANNTTPVHGNTGKLSKQTQRIRYEVEPRLKEHFTKKILPLSGPRPTRFTACKVAKRIITRDTNDIMELDPGNTKRRLYGDYAWCNGWKLVSTANGSIKKKQREEKN